jgi:hypothetical protein
MTGKALLLGGALTFALTGAAFAQADTQSSPTPSSQTRSAHHLRHHARHHMATAYLHRSSPGEREATRDLNLQQVRMAEGAPPPGPQYVQNAPRPMPPDRSLTPARRLPNGNALQSATPAGGRKDAGPPPARY